MRKKSLKESLERYVVDTGVLVEYIVKGSIHRGIVEKLFNDALNGMIELYVTPITISETIYVASRIYELAGIENPNDEALKFIEWLNLRVKIAEVTLDIIVEAGDLKKKFKIALSDCYVIATAIKLKAKALFLKPEEEMLNRTREFKELPIIFLSEIGNTTKNSGFKH